MTIRMPQLFALLGASVNKNALTYFVEYMKSGLNGIYLTLLEKKNVNMSYD